MNNKTVGMVLRRLSLPCGVALAFGALSFAQTANTSTTQFGGGPRVRITQAIDNSKLVTLHGDVNPRARAQFDQGAVPGSQAMNRITMLLQRSPDQETALEQLMAQQLDKSSPNYHKWLTPAEFGAQFGPADADIQAIKDWLTTQGFTNIRVSAGKTIVQFDGNAGLVQAAFHTPIHSYFVNGKNHFANVDDPQIPAALLPVVAGIVSLHNFRRKSFIHNLGTVQQNARTGAVRPLFTFTDVNGTFYAVGPADFAKIYNIPAGANGNGVSIAVVGRSNINLQDVRDFRSIFGLPANDPQIILNGPDPGLISGDETEADLDVEWSGAVAPGATIKFVTTQLQFTDSIDPIDASTLYAVDNNIAPILSDSFGSCEAHMISGELVFYNLLWQQAAAQGITVSVAAGDSGSAGCDDPNSESAATQGIAVSGLASTPYNVAMGGTDFDQVGNQSTYWNATNTSPTQASAKGYIPEVPWNDSCAATGLSGCANVTSASASLNIVAASGGPSSVYTKTNAPWQSGFGDTTWRDLPDLSLFSSDGGINAQVGSLSFYVICESDEDISGDTGCNLTKFSAAAPYHDFQAVGGTSAAAPTFAGIMALVNQKTGQRQGNANIVLYALAKNENFANCNSTTGPQSSCVFNDVTKGNISVACAAGTTDCSKTGSSGFGVMATTKGGSTIAYGTAAGYDLATGLGSINVANLLTNWASPTLTGTSTSLTLSPTSITVGASVSVSGTVTRNSGSTTPTGAIILQNASTGAPIDSTTLGTNGSYSFTSNFLPGGSYSVIAHYGGDSTFSPSDSTPPTPVNVTKQISKVIVGWVAFNSVTGAPVLPPVTSAQNVQYGSSYILRVDVANASGTTCQNISTGAVSFLCPTGTITLLDNGSPLNDFPNLNGTPTPNVANLNDRGYVEDQPIQLSGGTHSITATYSGDSSYTATTTSNTLSVTITQASTATALSASPTIIASGGSVTLTAVVSSQSNSSQGPTGTVQFKSGSANLGSAATCTPAGANNNTGVGASCTATLTTALSALPPGFLDSPRTPGLPVYLIYLASLCALICLYLATRLSQRRRVFAYIALILFAALAGGIAGCGGGSSGGGGGGGGGSARSITGSYSGDSNYAASSSAATTVTVQ